MHNKNKAVCDSKYKIALLNLLMLWVTPWVYAADAELLIIKQTSTTTPAAGEVFTYTIRYRCAATDGTYCPLATVTDNVPAPLKIVSHTPEGGNVASTNLNGKTLTWHLATPPDRLPEGVPADGLAAGSTGILKLQVKFPTCGAITPPATVSNQAVAQAGTSTHNSNAPDVIVPVATGQPCPAPPPLPAGDFSKTGSADFIQPGGLERWSVKLPNSSNLYHVTETIPAGMQVYTATASNTPKIMSHPEVDCTDNGVDDFHTINQPLLDWVAAEYNAGRGADLRNASGIATGCRASQQASGLLTLNAKHLRWVVNANSGNQTLDIRLVLDSSFNGDNLQNCASSSLHGTSCAPPVPVLANGQPLITISKTTPGGGIISANGSTITYNVVGWKPTVAPAPASHDHVYRAAFAVDELSGTGTRFPVIEDTLPAELDYLNTPAGNWWRVSVPTNKASTNQSACSNPRFSRTLQADGRVKLRWEFDGCELPAGMSDPALAVYFSTRIRPGTAAGTKISNIAHALTGDYPLVHCANGADSGKTWLPQCRSSTTSFTVPELTNLDSTQWVKGSLDASHTRVPGIGQTALPEGRGNYRLEIRNTGNVTHTQLEVEDVLPHTNDTMLVSGTPRGSAWQLALAGAVTLERVAADGTVQAIPGSELGDGIRYQTDPRAFRLHWIPATGLKPGETLRIHVPVQQADTDTASSGVAWNSFAYTAHYFDPASNSTETLLRTEPPRLGLVLLDAATTAGIGDTVWFDRNADGKQDADEPLLADVSVRLYDGAVLVAETLTDADGHYRFQGLLPQHPYTLQAEKPGEYPVTHMNATTGMAGSLMTDADVGFTLPAQLGDRVWLDHNADGLQDGDEPGVANVQVRLADSKGDTIAMTQTDPQGYYRFANLSAGHYVLTFTGLPANHVFTQARASGDPLTDSDTDTSGKTPLITLLAGDKASGWDAGIKAITDTGFSWGAGVDVSLQKTCDSTVLRRGATVFYTLTLSNTGPADATEVSVQERLPPELLFLQASPNGVYDPVNGSWNAGTVPAGTQTQLRIEARVK